MPNTTLLFPTDGRAGQTTIFRVFNAAGAVYRAASTAFVTYQQTQANAGDYDQATTEMGTSGIYAGTMPAAIVTADRYYFQATQAGQLVNDQANYWDGTQFPAGVFVPAGQVTDLTPLRLAKLDALGGMIVSWVNAVAPASANFSVFAAYHWTQTLTVQGMDSTGWTEFVFTMKRDAGQDVDSAAMLTVKVSNPSSGSDGCLIQNGATAGSASLASLTVSASTPDTTVVIDMTAGGMDLTPGTYVWELTRYKTAVKDPVGSGSITLKRPVRRSTAAA